MANEEKKDFNAMLHRGAGMPKTQIVTDPKTVAKYGGERMYFAPPIDYDRAVSYTHLDVYKRQALGDSGAGCLTTRSQGA